MRNASLRDRLLVTTLLALGASAAPAQDLDHGVEVIAGRFVAGAQPDGNSVLIDAPDGLIVVDTGRNPAHVQALIERIRAKGKPLRYIVNTHWHLDHIGGNKALRTAFPEAKLIASDAIVGARTGFLAEYRRYLAAELAKPAGDAAARAGLQRELDVIDDVQSATPDIKVDGAKTVDLAGRGVSIGVEANAVTGGDVWLYDAKASVLAVGDLVTLPAPLFDTACPERWGQALERIATLRFWWLVPGHGAPMSRGQFSVYRQAHAALLRCAAASTPKAQCIDEWIRDAGGLFPQAQQPLARTLLGVYFDGPLRGPGATANCPRG